MIATFLILTRGTLAALARRARAAFQYHNEQWNPWKLRANVGRLQATIKYAHAEIGRLHNAQRLGTKIVGCLTEAQIQYEHRKMMGHVTEPLNASIRMHQAEIERDYLAKLAIARRGVRCPKCDNYYGGHATGAHDICDCHNK